MEQNLKFKLAVYEYIDGYLTGYRVIHEVRDNGYEGLVMVSEPLDVVFDIRQKDEIVAEIVEGIEASIDKLRNETIIKINKLEGKKAEFLALTLMGCHNESK